MTRQKFGTKSAQKDRPVPFSTVFGKVIPSHARQSFESCVSGAKGSCSRKGQDLERNRRGQVVRNLPKRLRLAFEVVPEN